MDELSFVEAVEMRDHGVELVDHFLLLVRRQREPGDRRCARQPPMLGRRYDGTYRSLARRSRPNFRIRAMVSASSLLTISLPLP